MTNVSTKLTDKPERNIQVFHAYAVLDDAYEVYPWGVNNAPFYTIKQAAAYKAELEASYPEKSFHLTKNSSFAHHEESGRGYHNTVELHEISNPYEREWLRQVREAIANGLNEKAWSLRNKDDEDARAMELAQ